MRRFIGTWATTFARLGRRRRKRRRGAQSGRRSRFEPLECRHPLSATAAERGQLPEDLIRIDKAPDDFLLAKIQKKGS
jgi:hypothetical protein